MADNRTVVRSNNGSSTAVPWPLRAGLSALAAVSQGLAARAAERMFLSPPRHRAPERERAALSRATPFAVPFRGGRLLAWRFGEGPAVLLVHGWGGRGGQLGALVPPLLDAGCSAVTFDAPAHGGSSARIASVPAFADAVSATANQVGARAAVAHSMGAAGTALALRRGLPLDAAVFLGPPRSPAGFFQRFCDALELGPATRRATQLRIERRLGVAMADLDLARAAADMAIPLLVIHDRGDAEVPWADGASIARAWPGAQLLTTEGLGHRRILREPAVTGRAAAFVAEHLGRCRCGRPAVEGGGTDGRCFRCSLERELFDPSTRWVA